MTTWLHFVGRSYYKSELRFVREAERYGVTRRVSLAVLRSMAWGDRVLLVTRSGASSVVFGQFTVTRLSGFSADGAAAFAKVPRFSLRARGVGAMTVRKRKRKQLRLGRLRKTVRRVNTIYGLLVQAHDALRGEVIGLQNRFQELERQLGLKWSHREDRYVS